MVWVGFGLGLGYEIAYQDSTLSRLGKAWGLQGTIVWTPTIGTCTGRFGCSRPTPGPPFSRVHRTLHVNTADKLQKGQQLQTDE